jgi:uncharacterized protein YbaR (Trm112 family)
VKLDPVLLDILVCPDCKGSLTVDYDHEELICSRCGLIYPVRNDIPVMLVDEARRPPPDPEPAVTSDEQAAEPAVPAPADDDLADPAKPTSPPVS